MKLSYEDRMGSLRRHIKQGTLIRGAFTSEDLKGRETACLLAAMSPEVAGSEEPDSCPAHVMPVWLAELTPNIDDNGTDKHWFSMVGRYAHVAGLWPVLSKADWFELEIRAWQIAIIEYKALMPKALHAFFMGMYSSVENYRKVRRRLNGKKISPKQARSKQTRVRRPLHRHARTETPLQKKLTQDMEQWDADLMTDDLRIPASRRLNDLHLELDKMIASEDPEVSDAWGEASYSFEATTSRKMCWDRMTNLLFDAIEAQVKVAQERADLKAVQLSKRPRG